MPKQSSGLEQVLIQELQDLYDAEKQLVRALPKVAKAASDEELSNAIREHLEVTKGHVQRLEQVFESLGQRAKSKPCKGMKGIVEEANEAIQEDHEESAMDCVIAGGARRVEHYEMAAYDGAIAMTKQMGYTDAAELLRQTYDEEAQTDKQLAQIAKRILSQAGASQPEQEEEGGAMKNESREKKNSRGASRQSSAEGGHSARPLTDHDEIQEWAEERGAVPSSVRGTGSRGDTGMIRLNFPGYSGEESLEEISWDDWFEKFDANNLALIVQETTAGGQRSNFNKLVDRDSVEEKSPRSGSHKTTSHKAAGHKTASHKPKTRSAH